MRAAYPERCPLVLSWMSAGACTLRGQSPSAHSTIHQKAGIFNTAVRIMHASGVGFSHTRNQASHSHTRTQASKATNQNADHDRFRYENLQALLSLTSTVFADALSPTHYAMNFKVNYLLLNGSSLKSQESAASKLLNSIIVQRKSFYQKFASINFYSSDMRPWQYSNQPIEKFRFYKVLNEIDPLENKCINYPDKE